MSILMNNERTELIATCNCGCEDTVHIRIVKDEIGHKPIFSYITYMNGNFYRDQEDAIWFSLLKKLKKIYAIIRNKDFYYSEICMTKDDFLEFQKYISSIKVGD